MNEDFITLQCPNCGGNLEIGRNVTEYKCTHCGMEHLVRQSASGVTLEAFARCPVCGRNDKAEKVSSILRRQVQETETLQYETQTTYKKVGRKVVPVEEKVAVPVKTTQASGLAKLLMPPPKPELVTFPDPKGGTNAVKGCSVVLFIFGAVIMALWTGLTLSTSEGDGIGLTIFMLFAGLLISAVPVGIGLLFRKKLAPKAEERIETKRQEEAKRIEVYNSEIDKELLDWEKAMERYRNLYYCQRDDVVFIPGETESAPALEMNDLLFMNRG